ncbi:hypothetical protein [Drosophila suzukii associated hytrosavirus 1]|nr:hypothetical protein [Drosophila suzukii associated hytrosavirus 1]
MDSVFLEATNNIRAMHEIESILNNDDIPADSRSYFLQLISISLRKKLTPRQQKNVNIFRELFVRIDKDMRFFRTFLNVAVDLAEHFKFDNTSIVYAFKNLSLEEHFTNFVDFARRRNPVIDKNSPLQLFLTLGFSIIKLALQKNQIEKRQRINEDKKKYLFTQYYELSKGMSERFINLDFGEDILAQSHEEYTNDLDDFNNDDDEEEEIDNKSTTVTTFAEVHKEDVVVDEDTSSLSSTVQTDLPNDKDVEVVESDLEMKDDFDDLIKEIINDDNDDHDSGILKDDNTGSDKFFRTLENGDKELNLQNLDTLVMEASRQFGPMVLGMSSSSVDKEPIVRFQANNNVQNIVDFIKH